MAVTIEEIEALKDAVFQAALEESRTYAKVFRSSHAVGKGAISAHSEAMQALRQAVKEYRRATDVPRPSVHLIASMTERGGK